MSDQDARPAPTGHQHQGTGTIQDAGAHEASHEDLEEIFDETSTSLFEGDQGTLTFEQRKTLVAVLKNRYISAAEQPRDWRTLLEAREKITAALHNLFLDLHIDEQYQVAFKRQAQPEADGRFPTLLHDVAYGREDTILLIFLRQRFSSERAAGRDTVVVAHRELADAIAQFRPPHATDHAGDARRAEQAIERIRKAGLLARTPDPEQLRISPVIEVLLPVNRLAELMDWFIDQNHPRGAAPATDATPDTAEADRADAGEEQ
ncbi:DUF4194 domain-containing protein [Actinomadura sp. NPDC048955]|uniref:DUF4194 domain-containing protein n=1 Tax=Actinomadura sp. NPDC048955 TaxID=3158228 RepID=UPI00340FD7AC